MNHLASFPVFLPPAVRCGCVHVADKGTNRREAIVNAATAVRAAGDPAGAFMLRPLDATHNEVLTGRDLARELDKPKLEVIG